MVKGNAAVAPTSFHQDLRLVHQAEVHAHALPLPEVFGNGDVPTLAGVLPHAEELLEVGGPHNRGLIVSRARVDIVLGAVHAEVSSQLGVEGLSGSVAVRILDNVVLDERTRGPAVDPNERKAAGAPLLRERQVGAELAELLERLRFVKPETDPSQEVTRVVPLGCEGTTQVVMGGHAAAAAVVPEKPTLVANGAVVVYVTPLHAGAF